uniref:CSON012580 protein n=1 Tax=Culicoides sonorensis TaxID=179676 RepID=A0A336KL56_CULSO
MTENQVSCRLCLGKNLLCTNQRSYSKICDTIEHLILQYFNIRISTHDENLSIYICQICKDKVVNFNEFHKTVILNQEKFVSSEMSIDTEEEEDKIRIPDNLENLVKELDIENELIELDSNALNDEEFGGFALTPQRNVVKRVRDETLPKFACHICGKQLLNAEELEIHGFYHQLPEKKYETFKCDVCSKTYSRHDQFKDHLERHEFNPQYCKICDKQFDNHLKLKDHLRICHVPSVSELCTMCGKICKNKKVLKVHIHLNHQPQKTIQCKECNITLSYSRGLERHMREKHNPSFNKFQCSQCPKSFMSKRALEVHEARHDREKRRIIDAEAKKHKCSFCKELFDAAEDLQPHYIKVHPLEYALMRQKRFMLTQNLEYDPFIEYTLM